MPTKVLITEECGESSGQVRYATRENLRVERLVPENGVTKSLFQFFYSVFREIVLPHGYPETVSNDYLSYQIWDTVQAFCSTIIGSFTTRAILKGVGVGDAEANAVSAAITWIMKDGTGMIGRIVFAWWQGKRLDCDCKKWRLFADILNDTAMLIELVLPYFMYFQMELLCVTSTMKSIVGIAGGATRASITQHQAIAGNMADISAKDGTQETVVNLLASLTSIYLLNALSNPFLEWIFILSLILLHLLANYNAVNSLVFNNLNNARYILLLKGYLLMNTAATPQKINAKESVILGFGTNVEKICGFDIEIGQPLTCLPRLYNYEELKKLNSLYKEKYYLLITDVENRKLYVALQKGITSKEIIEAYFHAVLLACATCVYNHISLDVVYKKQRHLSNSVARLTSIINTMDKTEGKKMNLPIDKLSVINENVETEINMFFTSLFVNGWDIHNHSLNVGDWRANWKENINIKNE